MDDIEKGKNDLLDLRQGKVDAEEFLLAIKEVASAKEPNAQQAFDRLLPLAEIQAAQIENVIAMKNSKASSGAEYEKEQFEYYTPSESATEEIISTLKDRDNFSPLANKIAKSHLGNLLEYNIDHIKAQVENVLSQAKLATKNRFSHDDNLGLQR